MLKLLTPAYWKRFIKKHTEAELKEELKKVPIIFEENKSSYTCESFFKNQIVYDSFNSVFLDEFHIGKSRADLVKVEETEAEVLEIKTDLDSTARLQSQLNDYFKVFKKVSIVCGQKLLKEVIEKYQDTSVGIKLFDKQCIHIIKEASDRTDLLSLESIYKSIRKADRQSILKTLYTGGLPEVSQVMEFREYLELFKILDIKDVYPLFIARLYKRGYKEYDRQRVSLPFAYIYYFCKEIRQHEKRN